MTLIVEASRSGQAACKICREKIAKGALRVGREVMSQYGPGWAWHHAVSSVRVLFARTLSRIHVSAPTFLFG